MPGSNVTHGQSGNMQPNMQTSISRTFVIFRRTDGHCAMWLVKAPSLAEAFTKYYVSETLDAEILEDGSIRTQGCGSVKVVYAHPLECVESELKSYDGLCGNSWELRELSEQHWQADFAEVFCSADPDDVARYIERCRPLFQTSFPQSRARAFVWYLKTGPLVTFHRRKDKRCRHPIEILGRYHIPWKTWPEAHAWCGTYEEIMEQMALEYPRPT